MTLEPLKVDAELLGAAGQRLLTAAQGLPDAPEAFTPGYGSDALSQALSADVPKAEAPIIEGLPPLKQAAIGTAESVVEAARRYLSADSHLKSKIEETMNQPTVGGSSGGGGIASPATGSGGGGAAAAGAPAVAGGSAGGGMGAMGGMMGMPMQMAQQAGQIPQQIGGMAASLPQSVMQGAQQVGGQVQQMVEQFSGNEPDEKGEAAESGGKHRAEEAPAGAAPGQDEGERAPAASLSRPATPADPTINL
ncbi:hypothetical protein C6A86_010365 [Mycobacterium sp. ITM-2016-00316]|uniref:hypothetical protein n=1 Tax=Mycobacterium sp. ITM-2016-00316 TaxID=2099695 RepID=UPI0018EDB8D9|nr:hypothetical protein [Mycobacterium sp. ITM-2016-00316]WNG84004.1 hypothetical protein C6A86_010365 [Mycobacterium sp. ITM-2016-00316]